MRLFLVPSERQVEALSREGLAARTLRAVIRELADRVAPELKRAGPETTRLIAEAASERPDLAELLDSGIGALRQVGVGVAELSRLPGARARLFATTLGRADAALARAGLRDERGDAWLAAAGVGPDALPGVTELQVFAWARLGAGELRLLEHLERELSRRGGGVSVRFPGLAGEESRRAVESRQARLEARWANDNAPPGVARDEDKPVASLKLGITRTPNLAGEARAAVRAVQERLHAGARLDRIAIVPLELSEAFLEELRSALWTAKLPFSEPRGRPPVAGPNVHATLELLRLASGPIRRDALLDVLAAPGLRCERWFGAHERRGALALRELLARTPVGFDRDGRVLLERARSLSALRKDAGGAAAAVAGLELLLQDLRDLHAPRPRARLARDFAALVDELGLLRVGASTLRRALDARDAGAPRLLTALSDDARGAATLSLAMTRLVEAAASLGLADELVTPQQLSSELLRAMEGVGQGRGAARAGAIAVALPAEVAGAALDLAVVCRASAACFAKSAGAGSALALGAELWEALPPDRRPPSARDEETSTLVALNALLAGAARCQLIWSTSDGSSETHESRFVAGLLRALPALKQAEEPGSALAPGARRIAPLPPASGEVRARAAVELARRGFFFGQGELDELTGQVTELSRWIDPSLPPLPVTRLERYADCAFLGFASIVLRASRDEDVTDALGARERGILIHAAVAEALSAIAGRMHEPDEPLLREALAAAERSLAAHAGSTLRGAALRMALSDVMSLVRWSLEHRELAFHAAELAFGEGSTWPPLSLGPYRLSGRIDRVDVSGDGRRARVIDYKSGQAPSRNERHALQGWLYARKVAQELGASEVESLYLGLTRRVPHAKQIFSGAPDAPELAERERFALEAIERLRAGRVAAEPSRPSRCARCDARDICRRPLSAPLAEENGDEA